MPTSALPVTEKGRRPEGSKDRRGREKKREGRGSKQRGKRWPHPPTPSSSREEKGGDRKKEGGGVREEKVKGEMEG